MNAPNLFPSRWSAFRPVRMIAPILSALLLLLAQLVAGQPTTEMISVSSAGGHGDRASLNSALSADGRYVAFDSRATNLVPGVSNGQVQIYVRDRQTNATECVSVNNAGTLGNKSSEYPVLSADGRYIAFQSLATNLVPNDTNEPDPGSLNGMDIFVRDRLLGTTERVNVSSGGEQTTGGSSAYPAISADGRYVVFRSGATNLVPSTLKGYVYLHDRQLGRTETIDLSYTGGTPNWVPGGGSFGIDRFSLSADGRYVTFSSHATNLVPNDTNGNIPDVFLRDRATGTTEIVSRNSLGQQGDDSPCADAMLSPSGRFVVFKSYAGNFDLNHIPQIFLRDRQTATTECVSLNTAGERANSSCVLPVISADARFVAFESYANNLAPGDANEDYDIFWRDRSLGKTMRVSVNNAGVGGGWRQSSHNASISADGRYVAFYSSAGLTPNDAGDYQDVFLRGPVEAFVHLSGTVTLAGRISNGVSCDIAFTLRSANNPDLVQTVSIGAEGAFDLETPARAYTLHLKGAKYLAVNQDVDASQGDVSNRTATLLPGDIYDDNIVDLFDLVALFDSYGSAPGDADWNPNADLNGDGATIDLFDLVVLFDYYGEEGAP